MKILLSFIKKNFFKFTLYIKKQRKIPDKAIIKGKILKPKKQNSLLIITLLFENENREPCQKEVPKPINKSLVR